MLEAGIDSAQSIQCTQSNRNEQIFRCIFATDCAAIAKRISFCNHILRADRRFVKVQIQIDADVHSRELLCSSFRFPPNCWHRSPSPDFQWMRPHQVSLDNDQF